MLKQGLQKEVAEQVRMQLLEGVMSQKKARKAKTLGEVCGHAKDKAENAKDKDSIMDSDGAADLSGRTDGSSMDSHQSVQIDDFFRHFEIV